MSSKSSSSTAPALSKSSGGASFKCPIAIKISGFNKEASGFVTYSLDLQLIDADCLFPVQSRSASSSWKLRRRYSEFFALHQLLNERDMFRNLLPPVPPKVLNIFGEAPQDVAVDRKTELLQYISVVASNPLVYTTPEFCEFLEIQLREPISAEQMIEMLKASADKCGWLMKQGKYSLSGWKRRWFMLHSSFLLYFENESSPLNLGMINVTECTVIPGIDEPSNPSVDFSIYHPQKREFKLRCETPQEMPEWCRTLTAMESKVKLDDFELLSVIGQVQQRRRAFSVVSQFASHRVIQGTFGKVVRAKKKGTSDLYAIKILKKSHVRETAQIDHTLTERQVLQKVVHPYVVNLRSRPRFLCHSPALFLMLCRRYAFQTEDKLYMVMDYVRGGELYQHLKKFKFFEPQRVRLFAAEILLALSYLHDMHFVYRDLKPENLLLDEEGHIRLTDFGLAKKMGKADLAKTFCGTPEYRSPLLPPISGALYFERRAHRVCRYMAPEILQEVGHSFAVDWWCLGILIFEMHTGRTPFVSQNKKEMYINILKNPPVYPSSFPPLAKDLCNQLLHKDPKSRLGASSNGGRDIQVAPPSPVPLRSCIALSLSRCRPGAPLFQGR
jgi:RAC serine/threonine-protein kinase